MVSFNYIPYLITLPHRQQVIIITDNSFNLTTCNVTILCHINIYPISNTRGDEGEEEKKTKNGINSQNKESEKHIHK